jgi:hypothetical protein
MLLKPSISPLNPMFRRGNGKVIGTNSWERISVAEVLDSIPEINSHGFRCYGRIGAISDSEHLKLRADLLAPDCLGGLSARNLQALKRWLSSFVRAHRWKQDSYSLKHVLERETGTYMTNGAFIVALLMDGYEVKISGSSALIAIQRPAR